MASRFPPMVWAPTPSFLPSQMCRWHNGHGETGSLCQGPGTMSPRHMGVSHAGSIIGWWNTPGSWQPWTGSDRAYLSHLVPAPHLFCVLTTQIHIKCPTRCFELRTKIHRFKEKESGLEMHLMPSWDFAPVYVFMRYGVMSLCFELFFVTGSGILMRAVPNGELTDFVQLVSITSSDSYMRNLGLYLKMLFVVLNPLFHSRHFLPCFS